MSKDDCKTSTVELDLYTLDEASKKTHCGVPSILRMAADGRISLYTTIPIGWEIYSIETVALPSCQYKEYFSLIFSFRDNYFGTFENADPSIDLLILSTEDCKNIATLNCTKQGAFSAGLITNYNHPPLLEMPTQKKNIYKMRRGYFDNLGSLNRCFAICKKATSREKIINWNINRFPYQETTITKETIRIAHQELEKILNEYATCEPEEAAEKKALNNDKSLVSDKNTGLKNISQRLYTPGRAHTKLLQALYKVAKYSWEIFRATGKYPSNTEVETAIKKICFGCSNTLAEKSATMVRPPSCDRNESSDLFLTNYFWALVDTNEKFYRQSPPEEKIDQEYVLGWLENDLGFDTSLALAGSRIINPNFEVNKKSNTTPQK